MLDYFFYTLIINVLLFLLGFYDDCVAGVFFSFVGQQCDQYFGM